MERIERKEARELAEHAKHWGAEYTSEYLTGWRDPCPRCGRWHPPFHRHHIIRKGNGGTASDLVLLCDRCHIGFIHSPRPASAPPLDEEALFRPIADKLASDGTILGYLPVELCDGCGEWHSRKYMLDERQGGKPTGRRLCVKTCIKDILP